MTGDARSLPNALACLVVAVVACALAGAEPAKADPIKDLLPEKDLAVTINGSVKLIQDAIKRPGTFPNNAAVAEGEGYVLVILAQAAMANGDGRGPVLRDAALALVETVQEYRKASIAKNKELQAQAFAAIKEQVANLAKWENFKPAGQDDVPLVKSVKLKDLMEQVKMTNAEFIRYTRLNPMAFQAKAQQEEIIYNANKMLALTIGMVAHTPDKDPNAVAGKTVKLWAESSHRVRLALLELVQAGKQGDPKAFKDTFAKMDKACSACHEKFR